MKHIILCACFSFFVPAAVAQVQTGTVIVVCLTQEKVIMAADSRANLNDGRPASESECKIVALDSKVIFASSAIIGFRVNGPSLVMPWTNTGEASIAYFSSFPPGRGIADIADRWGQAIAIHLHSLYLADPQKIKAQLQGNNVLTQSYFAGIENGEPALYWTVVNFAGGLIVPQHPLRITCPLQHFCTIGDVEVVTEFTGLTSQRSKEEAASWKPSSVFNATDYDVLKAIRLVDLTIAYQKGSDVGGPIDAVQLNRDGSLRWFRRKANCPAN